jgi:SAM-dependent methyltransferase
MAFEYVDRSSCVCGAALAAGTRVVEKISAWGVVRFRQCGSCDSWCQSPQISPRSLAAWYDSDEYQGSSERHGSIYANYLADEPERLTEARYRYRRDLSPNLPATGARVLEIGCATGSLLAVMREAGHIVAGLDLSRRFADAARELHGLDVQVGDILDAALPHASFDMVVMLGTISNLTGLGAALERIRALLTPRGSLVFNFPAADSPVARLYGEGYWMFTPSVSTFLTERGCRLALGRAGVTWCRSRVDRQMPSVRKLLTHAKLGALLRAGARFGMDGAAPLGPLPIPGVQIVWATPA